MKYSLNTCIQEYPRIYPSDISDRFVHGHRDDRNVYFPRKTRNELRRAETRRKTVEFVRDAGRRYFVPILISRTCGISNPNRNARLKGARASYFRDRTSNLLWNDAAVEGCEFRRGANSDRAINPGETIYIFRALHEGRMTPSRLASLRLHFFLFFRYTRVERLSGRGLCSPHRANRHLWQGALSPRRRELNAGDDWSIGRPTRESNLRSSYGEAVGLASRGVRSVSPAARSDITRPGIFGSVTFSS